MKKIIEEFKMIVSFEESIRVQKFLIKNGYYWNPIYYDKYRYDCDDIQNIEKPYLFLCEDSIHCTMVLESFQISHEPELTCEEFFDKYDISGQRMKKLKILKDKDQEKRFDECRYEINKINMAESL